MPDDKPKTPTNNKNTSNSAKNTKGKELIAKPSEKAILDTMTLDVGDIKLTEKEKRFVFWYTYPGDSNNPNDAFQIQSKAARKAGYKNPVQTGYKLRRKENIAKAINIILDKKIRINLEEAYHKVLEAKKARAFFDIADFVEVKSKLIKTPSGEVYEVDVEELKNIKDLTPQQRQVIDGIDYRGVQGIRVYEFANREKAQNDLLNLYTRIKQEENDGDFDDEFTYEAIKEKLTIKCSVRNKKQQMAQSVDFIEVGNSEIEEL